MAGRPKEDDKHRMTVVLSSEANDLVRAISDVHKTNLSATMNLILTHVVKGNFESLKEISREYNTGRQF